uniref:SRP54-type proteins GTP-binding domain-containing protein n=1 Tax=Chromera velia CCMP2878 TaxID=1169474 RepID=A0A0G4HDE6_9ALVE|eukprot:Cvel_942.t1-p1 / transcript=Cvel_942.t1 / gene=Cvel_942 / organism=Chromera_velia_CCMP2878 / gene_product=Signal recognition particle receptor subunit alpha, putative / transcript_product=Signal recognition particle receptor subunit alpha, putative / location=Cvel_scaffold30:94698-102161(+) / protein_length=632 / sequence_SO=supercontig / SO=protein_coding / is_pseudo=false
MIDAVVIFTKGGLILWSYYLLKSVDARAIVDELVKTVLLEERTGETAKKIDDKTNVKWKLVNDLGLIFVVAYQGILPVEYLESLLNLCKSEFVAALGGKVGMHCADLSLPLNFEAKFKQILDRCDRQQLDSKKRGGMRSFADTKRGQEVIKDKGGKGGGKGGKKKGQGNVEAESEGEEGGGDGEEDPTQEGEGEDQQAKILAARAKLQARMKGGNTKKKKEEKSPEPAGKSKKGGSDWHKLVGGEGPISKKAMDSLDRSRDAEGLGGKGTVGEKDGGIDRAALGLDEEIPDSEDEDELLIEDLDESGGPKDGSAKKGIIGGLFHRVTNSVQGITGNKVLTKDDLEPVLKDFKQALMAKNVAADIAENLAESLKATVVGTKTERFTSVATTVKQALVKAIERILTPKKSIDVLRAALEAKANNRVFSICFLGVNGVGKSTNLAKVCYYLKHKGGLNVMMAACDTFRAGAVEQLRTHARNLDVYLFERGYGKDAAQIAKEALAFAEKENFDVVLIDTAGRMQDNEPLMRALAKLVAWNSPDLVLFVGEALVGNDAVDQLKKFNQCLVDMAPQGSPPRLIDGILLTKFDTVDDKVGAALSMVYITGQPVVFVGTGQKYPHLRKMNVNTVIKALLG